MTSSQKYELSLRAYRDIVNGYSVVRRNGEKVYIKHLRDVDYALFEQKKHAYREEASSRGLLSEEENLEMLNETGNWSKAEESKYQAALKEIENLKKTESQIFLDSQRKIISQRVKEKEKELTKIGEYRNLTPLVSVEEFATDKLNFFIMQFCFCKESDLKENLFTEKEFFNLEMEDINQLTELYFRALYDLGDKNIKRIASLGIFINGFMLARGNPYFFFNRSVCSLTSYQTLLCNFGSGYKSILEQSENDMPSYDDIDDSVAWYERERDIIKRKYSSNKSSPPSSSASGGKSPKSERFEGISVPNASEEEMEAIGFDKQAQPMNLVEAAEKLKKKLGKDSLDIHDMVKLHS